MKIHTYPNNYRVWKARITANLVGVAFPEKDTPAEIPKDTQTEGFLALNPFGQVPTLELQGGQGVFESNSIARYIARLGESSARQGKKGVNLYGSNIAEASRIDSFLDHCTNAENWFGPVNYKLGDMPWTKGYTKSYIDDMIARTLKALQGFETGLRASGKYFVGNAISLADVIWFCVVHSSFKSWITKEYAESKIPLCYAHFRRLEALPEFKSVAGGPLEFAKTDKTQSLVFEEAKGSAPSAPVRWHRIATISDGKQTMKLKLYAESQAVDIQDAIKARFRLEQSARLILQDEDSVDVVIDGTLETGTYKLSVGQ